MARKLVAGVLIASMLIAGCAGDSHLHGGKLIAEHKPGDSPDRTHTPYRATYVLYQWLEPPADKPPHTWIPEREAAECYVRGLGRWETIGFDKDANGGLVAVAGAEKIPLADGRYCWHISTETEYRGLPRVLHEIGENTLYVASLPVGVAFAAVTIPFVMLGGLGLACLL
jgi:hypothetical protein